MKSSRLKNFCQLCRKQCRDQNGYICHVNSVSHQRRIQQYKNDPSQHIQKYSSQLQRKFIYILKSKYPGQSKSLQQVYTEYSQDKRFIKFSVTKWRNLGEFGDYLKDVKNVKIIGTPPDCKITYQVNKSMDFIQKNKKQQIQLLKQKEKQIFQKSLANRIERQKLIQQKEIQKFEQQFTKNQRQKQHLVIPDKLQFTFEGFTDNFKRTAFVTNQQLQAQLLKQRQSNNEAYNLENNKMLNSQKLLKKLHQKQQKNEKKFQTITKEQQLQQQQCQWLLPGILIKIMPHQIDPIFHNKKTKILQIVQPYIARVKVGTATIQIDQAYLQTVIPKIGYQVMVLIGDQKGTLGVLREVDLSAGFGQVQITQNRIVRLPFNHFSKYQSDQP